MKIAHVISYFQPKLGYQEFYLAKEQLKMGHDVCIVTSDRYAPFPDFSKTVGSILGERLVGQGVFVEEGLKVVRLPLIFEFASDNALLGLKRALASFSPDVVHAHGATALTTMATIAFKTFLNYKVVVDCHMDYSLESKSKIRRTAFYLWSRNPVCRWMLKRADGYIAVAGSVRRWLSREWGLCHNRIQVIPLGAESELFSPNMLKREMMRRKLGVEEEDVLIIYAGKLIPEKDIEVLLNAVAILLQTDRNIKVLLVGSGPDEYIGKLFRLIDKYKIRRNVLLHPFQHKTLLPDYYNAADIGIWPGNPSITIVEAMATGMPIIIPHCTGSYSTNLHHYVQYDNGFEFEEGNTEELCDYLKKLVTDKKLRKKMGLRSRKLVEEKLDWSVIAVQTLKYYEKIFN